MTVLAIDPGKKRIGIAVSDDREVVAVPLPALPVGPGAAHLVRIARIAAEHRVERIVVGLPLALDGRESGAARDARRLADEIAGITRLHVNLVDERLTTAQAERDLIALGMRRDRRRRTIDSTAAAILLQAHLDGTAAVARGAGEEPDRR